MPFDRLLPTPIQDINIYNNNLCVSTIKGFNANSSVKILFRIPKCNKKKN